MLKIGVVPYLNALPLCRYLNLPLTYGTPVELENKMAQAELDLALLPIATLFKNPHYFSYPQIGVIQSQGAVESVAFFYDQKIKNPWEVKNIRYSPESVSSNLLFKVIFQACWKKTPVELTSLPQPDGFIEIGDRALFFNKPGYQKCDLGYVWTKWTGLPFVYALWVARRPIELDVLNQLEDAKLKGLKHIEELVTETRDVPPKRLLHYLTKSISYERNEQTQSGIDLFKSYCREFGLIG